jgi:outer membrane receptor protein involved in Fe transport
MKFVPCFSLLLAAVVLNPASAQVAPAVASTSNTPAGTTATKGEEAIELSPFVVDASKDTGYAATNTLAGSRLNSPLKEIPAPISIMTPEFMADANITNIDEAIGYGVNTSLRENAQDGAADSFLFGGNYRIRGTTSQQSARNYFVVNSRGDAYNIESATFARGPNSILFGAADPAGIVNVSTNKAVFRNLRQITARIDSEGGARYTTDINQIVVPNRIAIRIDAMKQQLGSYQAQNFTDEDRLYVAGTIKIFDKQNFKTTFRFDTERGLMNHAGAQKSFPTNRVSEWLRRGSQPVTTGTTVLPAATQTALGVQSQGTTNRIIAIVSGSTTPIVPLNWKNTYWGTTLNFDTNNTASTLGPVFTWNGVGGWSSANAIPLDVNISGSDATNPMDFSSTDLFLEQQIGRNLFFELAYTKYLNDIIWWQPVGDLSLSVDPNTLLPNGLSNPNYGRYFYDEQTNVQRYGTDGKEYRFTASYDLDLTKYQPLLGHHRIAGLYDERDSGIYKTMLQEQILNGNTLYGLPADLSNAQNRLTRRHYIDPSTGNYSMGDFKTPFTAGGMQTGFIPVGLNSIDYSKTVSKLAVAQSYFFNRRLTTILGWRSDSFTLYNADPVDVFRQSNGVWNKYARQAAIDFAHPSQDFTTDTKSFGAVFSVSKPLSVFFNSSDNFSPQVAAKTVLNKNLDQPVGKGKDYGVKFDLLNGKLIGTLGRFESSKQGNVTNFGPSNGLVLRLNDLLRIAGRSSEVFLNGFSDSRDQKAEGYEFEVTANPFNSLRISANVSYTKNIVSNVLPALRQYLEVNRASLVALGNAPSVDFTGTAQDSLVQFDTGYLQQIAQEGQQPQAHRQYMGNIVTRYTFPVESFLKGFSMGGTYRYYGKASLGYPVDATGAILTGKPYFGAMYSLMNLNLNYEAKIGFLSNRTRISFAVTVENVYDKRILDANSDGLGRITQQRTIKPRTYYFTTKLTF